MMTPKRPRGRPKGSCLNDARHLDAVADLLLREPGLKKTPAISNVVQKAFPEHQWSAVERRLLRKWNQTGEERLQAAQERRDERRHQVVSTKSLSLAFDRRKIGDFALAFTPTQEQLQRAALSSALQRHASAGLLENLLEFRKDVFPSEGTYDTIRSLMSTSASSHLEEEVDKMRRMLGLLS